MRCSRLGVECGFGHVDGFGEGGGFVDGLVVFVGGNRIGDDAGAGLEVDFPVGGIFGGDDDHGAQGDGHVHIVGEVDVADGAGVGSAAGRFKFIDNLHGADFGRAADGADGHGGAEGVPAIAIIAKFAGDGGRDVHDVAVALDDHDGGQVDGAGLRDFTDVVSTEVDEHDVFGAFLGIGEEFGFEGFVFGVGLAAAPSAGEGAVGDDAIVDAAEDLGAGPDEHAAFSLEVEHVGRGVDDAQGAVDVERIDGGNALETLGEDDLKNVAGGDVLFGLFDDVFELRAGHVGRAGRGGGYVERSVAGSELDGGGLKAVDEIVEFAAAVLVGGFDGRMVVDADVIDSEDGFAHVIEGDDLAIEGEIEIGQVAIVAGGVGEFFGFDVADGVVACVADPAAGEVGQLGDADEIPVALLGEFGDFGEGVIGVELAGDRSVLDRDGVVVGDDAGDGLSADEAVTTDAVAADDGFEQEAGGVSVVGLDESPVGEYGGEVVGHQLAVDRHEIAGPGEFLEGVEIGLLTCHGGVSVTSVGGAWK